MTKHQVTQVLRRIVEVVEQADKREIDGSDAATERDLETFDEIVDILTEARLIGDLQRLR